SSSPVVVDNAVVVQVENEVNSMAMGIDKRTGAELWHVDRPKRMNWSSPGVLRGAEHSLVLLQNGEYLSAHHPQTGEQAWRYEKGCSTIVSPVAVGDNVFVRSGSGTVKLLRKGTTPELEVAWDQPKLSSESASPVLHEGRIYTVNRAGVATCAREDTGAVVWQLRLKGPFWASPVLVGGKLYCFNHEGVCQVVELGEDAGKVVAQNELGDKVLGSPAVADDAMYVRSEGAVWKIAQP
ncbi:MAG: PQQ-binding-like beta-propeller repeat protein, partial [Planctomycetales bacterium]|nr:PQQ-binding-like beta-propeller repeat protein [Planctomycetales bacterium]